MMPKNEKNGQIQPLEVRVQFNLFKMINMVFFKSIFKNRYLDIITFKSRFHILGCWLHNNDELPRDGYFHHASIEKK